jgi:hypothetical protein
MSRRDGAIVAWHEVPGKRTGISWARSDRALRNGSFERRFPRHFVPGYDRCCPYGTRWQTFRNRIIGRVLLATVTGDELAEQRFEVANQRLPVKQRQKGIPSKWH